MNFEINIIICSLSGDSFSSSTYCTAVPPKKKKKKKKERKKETNREKERGSRFHCQVDNY